MNPQSKRALKKEQKIKEENIKKLDERIKQEKIIPQEYKTKMRKQFLANIAIASMMIVWLIAMNILFSQVETVIYMNLLKVASIMIAFVSIIFFEMGYKKDSEKTFLHGVEVLIFAMVVLFSIYMYFIFFDRYNQILTYLTVAIAIYYIVKIMVIRHRMKKQYYKDHNDIKEIVKKR